jgi:hypothetical protein
LLTKPAREPFFIRMWSEADRNLGRRWLVACYVIRPDGARCGGSYEWGGNRGGEYSALWRDVHISKHEREARELAMESDEDEAKQFRG